MKTLTRHILILGLLTLLSVESKSEVRALFHPYDPTLETIAQDLLKAETSINLALYNISTSSTPIINALGSTELQNKIKQGLKVRIILESDSKKIEQKTKVLEDLNADVRTLKSKKMHHKFGIIDSHTLITGSANWSSNSAKYYNENILFIQEEPEIISHFEDQFELLWSLSSDVGAVSLDFTKKYPLPTLSLKPDLKVFFNTKNFLLTPPKPFKENKSNSFTLTRKVVQLIDEAQSKLEIASARIRLRPIYEAILRALKRGVKVEMVVNQSSFPSKKKRGSAKLNVCSDKYLKSCSKNQNFVSFLHKETFDNKKNLKLKVKFFNLNKANHITNQMHNKYMIIDETLVVTGSFNWSLSAEFGHIENIVVLDGNIHTLALQGYQSDFAKLWTTDQEYYEQLKKNTKCRFNPIFLTINQIDVIYETLLDSGFIYWKKCKSLF